MSERRAAAGAGAALAGSLLLSVLVAWGLAAWGVPTVSSIAHTPTHAEVRARGGITVPDDWSLGAHVLYTGAGGGFRYDLVTEQHWMGSLLGSMSGSANRSVERVQVGWPARCLEWHGMERSGWPNKPGVTPAPARTGLAKAWWEGAAKLPASGQYYPMTERRLPIKPVWTGLALCLLFYGCVIAACIWCAGRVRAILRARRGRCVVCGYSMAGLNGRTCPECGIPAAQSLANTQSMR